MGLMESDALYQLIPNSNFFFCSWGSQTNLRESADLRSQGKECIDLIWTFSIIPDQNFSYVYLTQNRIFPAVWICITDADENRVN